MINSIINAEAEDNPTPFGSIKSARKRCLSMGKPHGWRRKFDSHSLAPVIDNYTAMIDVALEERDYLSALIWLDHIAKAIMAYCDQNKVSGDDASEYWLERFLWRIDSVADLTRLQ